MMKFALGLVAGAFLASGAVAGTISIMGDTTGGPTWNRPLGGFPPTPPASGVGTAVPFMVTQFTVTADGVYDFLSTADYDNYLHLYVGQFDADDQFNGLLAGNDDFGGNIGLSGFSFALTAGLDYFAVNSGFSNEDFGAFTMRITGPGDIAVVPEAATWAMMIAGFGLVGAAARPRRLVPAEA